MEIILISSHFPEFKVMNISGEKSIDTRMIHNLPNEEINHSAPNLNILSVLYLCVRSKRNYFNIKSNRKLFQTLTIAFYLNAGTRWNDYRCRARPRWIFNGSTYGNCTVMLHRTPWSHTKIRRMPIYR